MRRLPFLGLAGLVILAGLLLRLVPWGLPLPVHHIGGGVLWGAMVFLLVATCRPPRWNRAVVIAAACAIALAVELLRLLQTPALDAFRMTLAGQLLLGRLFSGWNLVAYALGIAVAAFGSRGFTWTAAKSPHGGEAIRHDPPA